MKLSLIFILFVPGILLIFFRLRSIKISLQKVKNFEDVLQECNQIETDVADSKRQTLYGQEEKVEECLEKLEELEMSLYDLKKADKDVKIYAYAFAASMQSALSIYVRYRLTGQFLEWMLIAFIFLCLISTLFLWAANESKIQ